MSEASAIFPIANIATHFYDKAHPKTIIILAEAGNKLNQNKRSSLITTVITYYISNNTFTPIDIISIIAHFL